MAYELPSSFQGGIQQAQETLKSWGLPQVKTSPAIPIKPSVLPKKKYTVTFSNWATVTFDWPPKKEDIDHVASTPEILNYKKPETPIVQDLHSNEWILPQAAKSIYRGGKEFLQWAAQDVSNLATWTWEVVKNTYEAWKALATWNYLTKEQAQQNQANQATGFLKATSGATGILTDIVPATAATKVWYNIASEAPWVQYIPQTINAGVGLVNKGIEAAWVSPENARNITNIASNLALLKWGTKWQAKINEAPTIWGKVLETAKQVPQTIVETAKLPFQAVKALTPKKAFDVNDYIMGKYEKWVRPSLSNVKQPNFQKNVLWAVKTIAEVKPKLVDEFWETNKALPKNLIEFKDAIDKTKEEIFKQYDSLQKKAGEKWAEIKLKWVAKELDKIANDPVMRVTNPAISDYAQKASERFLEQGKFTPQQAQDAIKAYNTSLNAFYKNPSYETASKAWVDAMIVNNIRKWIDSSIENATWENYQELKTKYWQLNSIDSDVLKRWLVDARKNTKWLLDFTDIATGAETIKSILTLDPASFATGVSARLIKEYYKYLNNPNTSIKQLFSQAGSNLPKIWINAEKLQSLKTGLKNAWKNLTKSVKSPSSE